MQVLVVEDEPVTRSLISDLLRTMGYQVTVAEDGQEAWRLLCNVHFPVVITDWMMPGMDGLDLCRRIRSARRTAYTYMMLLTVREGRADFLEGMEAGADDFLSKPVDPDTLRARLRVAERVLGLERTVTQLKGLLPICMYCQKVRDGGLTDWQPMDRYLAQRTNTTLSHGVCPECAELHLAVPGRSATR